tara:strand:- start:1216 stop:2364 length:1149 start_codon:yes stop_codon:yes gene_type:complete
MLSSPILLDYQSSTPCLREVVEEMSSYWISNFANPSSKGNLSGLYASAALEVARDKIKENLNVNNKKIIFTSGATESNNLALLGFARHYKEKTGKSGNIITLKTEHHAVLEPVRQLKKEGFNITELFPEQNGLISEDKILNEIKEDTFLISIMFANNEIGVIQPIQKIFQICRKKEIKFHTDAAQCLGYIPIVDFNSIANMITLSSHKIYGPKGVGLLIVDHDIQLNPLIYGGGQEFGYRSGTIPLPLIIGFSKAIELALENQVRNSIHFANLRDNLMDGLLKNNSNIEINGSIEKRLPNNLNITVFDTSGSNLHKSLKSQIICSSGSACSNGKPSHVLMSLGRSFKEAEASIRLSMGLNTTAEEIQQSIDFITNAINRIRN